MSAPVELDREAAREVAREELAKQVYQEAGPSLTERLVLWLVGRLEDALNAGAEVAPGGYGGFLVLLLLLVVAVVAVRLRLGPLGARTGGRQSLFTGAARTAAQHREAADRHEAEGDLAEAVRERLRAIVRSLEERSVLEPRPGRTATEAAREAGQALPTHAAALADAARIFEDVWYGGRPATSASAQQLREVDRALAGARLALR